MENWPGDKLNADGSIGLRWVAAQIVVLLLCFGLPGFLPKDAAGEGPIWILWLHDARVAFTISGILLLGLGVIGLGRNLTPFPRPKSGGMLVTSGIYRYVRHPMYGGILLLALASALRASSWMMLLVVMLAVIFFDRKADVEEQLLTRQFDCYDRYRHVTKKLIPWVY